jgi:hypothetical protein
MCGCMYGTFGVTRSGCRDRRGCLTLLFPAHFHFLMLASQVMQLSRHFWVATGCTPIHISGIIGFEDYALIALLGPLSWNTMLGDSKKCFDEQCTRQ